MKKSIALAALTLIIICHAVPPAYTQKKDTHNFRKTRWGMSVAEVKLTEEGKPINEGPLPPYDLAVSYAGTFEGSNTETGYLFNADKLVLAGYAFTDRHSDNNLYIKDYERIKGVLTKKYGIPAQDEEIWSDETYKDKPEEYGKAAALGQLVLQSSWRTPETDIFLTLQGRDNDISLSALYYSTELNSLVIERKIRQEAEGF
ncbi:MAG: hypothetical protein RIG61_11915 [Deltaproteobacteria bacterium]